MVNEDRTKFGADALAVMGVGGVIFMFYHLAAMQPGQPLGAMTWVYLVLMLGAIGALIIYPGWFKQVFEVRHPDFVMAGEAGISLAQKDGLPAQFRTWDAVAEVILARKFRMIYSNGHVDYRQVVVIFLKPGNDGVERSLGPTQSGVSESGAGRRYLSADFPDGDWSKFESALHQFAPKGVKVKVCSKAVFDRKAGVDHY